MNFSNSSVPYASLPRQHKGAKSLYVNARRRLHRGLNVDTVAIANRLSRDATLRQSLDAQA